MTNSKVQAIKNIAKAVIKEYKKYPNSLAIIVNKSDYPEIFPIISWKKYEDALSLYGITINIRGEISYKHKTIFFGD